MNPLFTFAPDDLKKVYRVLHQHLLHHPELLDSQFLEELQGWLQSLAQAQGVDISDHGQWDAWLDGEEVVVASGRPHARLRLVPDETSS